MAQVENPRKSYNFRLDITGIGNFYAQEVDLPDSEIDKVEHGDSNYDVSSPGKTNVTDLMIQKLLFGDASDSAIWIWHVNCQNSLVGGSAPPSEIRLYGSLTEFATDQVTVVNSWWFEGLWPFKINGQKFKRGGESENAIENIEFSVDRMQKVGGAASPF